MQILYLVGVGLLLTFDLLACVDSQGMLFHVLMPKCTVCSQKYTNALSPLSQLYMRLNGMQLTLNVGIGYLHFIFKKLLSKE